MLTLVSAVTYSGESSSFLVPEQYDYYSIVGNITPIILNVTQEGLNVTITINKYQQADNFKIIFFNKEKEKITTVYSGGGGGGGSIKYIDRNITILEPKFFDRNITIEKEVPVEVVIYGEDIYDTWIIIVSLIGGFVAGMFAFRRKKDAEQPTNLNT